MGSRATETAKSSVAKRSQLFESTTHPERTAGCCLNRGMVGADVPRRVGRRRRAHDRDLLALGYVAFIDGEEPELVGATAGDHKAA